MDLQIPQPIRPQLQIEQPLYPSFVDLQHLALLLQEDEGFNVLKVRHVFLDAIEPVYGIAEGALAHTMPVPGSATARMLGPFHHLVLIIHQVHISYLSKALRERAGDEEGRLVEVDEIEGRLRVQQINGFLVDESACSQQCWTARFARGIPSDLRYAMEHSDTLLQARLIQSARIGHGLEISLGLLLRIFDRLEGTTPLDDIEPVRVTYQNLLVDPYADLRGQFTEEWGARLRDNVLRDADTPSLLQRYRPGFSHFKVPYTTSSPIQLEEVEPEEFARKHNADHICIEKDLSSPPPATSDGEDQSENPNDDVHGQSPWKEDESDEEPEEPACHLPDPETDIVDELRSWVIDPACCKFLIFHNRIRFAHCVPAVSQRSNLVILRGPW